MIPEKSPVQSLGCRSDLVLFSTMTEPTLELDEHPKPGDFRIILDGVRAFNRVQTGN
jgi:hypothetical protein